MGDESPLAPGDPREIKAELEICSDLTKLPAETTPVISIFGAALRGPVSKLEVE